MLSSRLTSLFFSLFWQYLMICNSNFSICILDLDLCFATLNFSRIFSSPVVSCILYIPSVPSVKTLFHVINYLWIHYHFFPQFLLSSVGNNVDKYFFNRCFSSLNFIDAFFRFQCQWETSIFSQHLKFKRNNNDLQFSSEHQATANWRFNKSCLCVESELCALYFL